MRGGAGGYGPCRLPRRSLSCCFSDGGRFLLPIRRRPAPSVHTSLPLPRSSAMVLDHNLHDFLQILPLDLRHRLLNDSRTSLLVEVIMDLGRPPEARYLGDSGGRYLRTTESLSGADNRAGIEGTLHRISATRSRKGSIVGHTCRFGRVVSGQIDMLYDLLHYGKSILFVRRFLVAASTLYALASFLYSLSYLLILRKLLLIYLDEFQKRVVIIDTSNEIGGDGDISHSAIGGARRMQVPESSLQHKVMIEAVENHMPQVIIVDEIGTEAEALACRSIAERGVMFIGTAHGEQLQNIIKNPALSELIGGIETVTLGDEEARARRCQKRILERKMPPTFYFLIEMRERDHLVAHQMEKSVDMLLRGRNPMVEVRKRDEQFKVVIERWKP